MVTLTENKKAYYDYQVLEKIEGGLLLIGQEVKSIKSGWVNLTGSYVVLRGEEVYLIGCHIPPYQAKNAPSNYSPERPRKVLLKKAEIKYLIGKVKQKGLTLVPLKLYTKKGKIKLEFGIVKGKRKADKRETIRKREAKREIKKSINGGA